MTPKTIDECYNRLGLTHRPTHLEMVTTAKLREMVRCQECPDTECCDNMKEEK